jgi:hypothetical protein
MLFSGAIFTIKNIPTIPSHMFPSTPAPSTRVLSWPHTQRQYHSLRPAIPLEYWDVGKSEFEPLRCSGALPATIQFWSGLVLNPDPMDYRSPTCF